MWRSAFSSSSAFFSLSFFACFFAVFHRLSQSFFLLVLFLLLFLFIPCHPCHLLLTIFAPLPLASGLALPFVPFAHAPSSAHTALWHPHLRLAVLRLRRLSLLVIRLRRLLPFSPSAGAAQLLLAFLFLLRPAPLRLLLVFLFLLHPARLRLLLAFFLLLLLLALGRLRLPLLFFIFLLLCLRLLLTFLLLCLRLLLLFALLRLGRLRPLGLLLLFFWPPFPPPGPSASCWLSSLQRTAFSLCLNSADSVTGTTQ